jgi:hypothetical protein
VGNLKKMTFKDYEDFVKDIPEERFEEIEEKIKKGTIHNEKEKDRLLFLIQNRRNLIWFDSLPDVIPEGEKERVIEKKKVELVFGNIINKRK